ncbi:MAG: hypothetical protein NWP69_01850 [Congregibacter sp.]|nr:hypothetical protein [Congregibacter sp.]
MSQSHSSDQFTRRAVLAAALTGSAVAAGLLAFPTAVLGEVSLKTSNKKSLAGIKQVRLGSVGLAFLTERRRQITVGGGFRSKGAASQATVRTDLTGLGDADFQAAADAAYATIEQALTAAGIEVLDNSELITAIAATGDVQANAKSYSFPEGNKQNSEAIIYGASVFGGFIPLPQWVPMAAGLAGIGSTGQLMAANRIEALFAKQAQDDGVPVLAIFIGVSPVRIEADFGSDWRMPDAFGNGGLTSTGSLSTETGLSSHPLLTKLELFPVKGRKGQVTMKDEIGIQGGFGSLEDTTDGVTKTAEGIGNVLSVFGGSGRQSSTTRYTLIADAGLYSKGVGVLAGDVASALAGALS